MNTLRKNTFDENIAFEVLNQAKKDYASATDVYDLIEMEIFLDSNYFILYCWIAKENPLKVEKEILSQLPSERRFKRVTVGRIAHLMNYPGSKAIDWCVKNKNCQMKKGRQKMLDYKQAKKLVRYIQESRK